MSYFHEFTLSPDLLMNVHDMLWSKHPHIQYRSFLFNYVFTVPFSSQVKEVKWTTQLLRDIYFRHLLTDKLKITWRDLNEILWNDIEIKYLSTVGSNPWIKNTTSVRMNVEALRSFKDQTKSHIIIPIFWFVSIIIGHFFFVFCQGF